MGLASPAPGTALTIEMLEQAFEFWRTQPIEPDKTFWRCCGRAGYVWGPARCPSCGRELP